jgi:hypothetical protein
MWSKGEWRRWTDGKRTAECSSGQEWGAQENGGGGQMERKSAMEDVVVDRNGENRKMEEVDRWVDMEHRSAAMDRWQVRHELTTGGEAYYV